IHFTSGTTGSPKAVPLTHRNLTANAAQVAAAHELAAGTVTLNHLPAYHLMHLNAAVHAGATQVLCRSTDTAEAVALANATAATRLFDLPVRLARLAADPRLPGLRLGTVQAIMSGGSALSSAVATARTNHFGSPVLQGDGLAEASPLTHCDRIADPRPGSVGPAVAGTECAITDLDTGAPLPRGKRGEVRVRGPQVMRGYLDSDEQVVDRDGWLRTGDVGYEDADGRLYLVDRIGDVFKCDNELVAPTEVERVLLRHPDVADCVVFGVPDEYSGAVAHALIVPACPGTDLGAVMRAVNAGLPYVQELRKVEAVARIPRSPAGKVSRRELGRAYESGER
ncbi:MAG: long-chain fatty acid--CoA ligase, partial [Nonomuraea sp.]|nr:long-chain fatty acid--CoA ligase [Nonomuraea sp.]